MTYCLSSLFQVIELWWKLHPALCGAACLAVANTMITSMPSPSEKSGELYRWFFTFTHAIILAIPRLMNSKPFTNGGEK